MSTIPPELLDRAVAEYERLRELLHRLSSGMRECPGAEARIFIPTETEANPAQVDLDRDRPVLIEVAAFTGQAALARAADAIAKTLRFPSDGKPVSTRRVIGVVAVPDPAFEDLLLLVNTAKQRFAQVCVEIDSHPQARRRKLIDTPLQQVHILEAVRMLHHLPRTVDAVQFSWSAASRVIRRALREELIEKLPAYDDKRKLRGIEDRYVAYVRTKPPFVVANLREPGVPKEERYGRPHATLPFFVVGRMPEVRPLKPYSERPRAHPREPVEGQAVVDPRPLIRALKIHRYLVQPQERSRGPSG